MAQTEPAVADLQNLAEDFETVWNAPGADVRLKKRLIRTLVHEIMADIDETTAEVVLVIHWQGGVHTELRVPRRRRGHCSDTAPAVLDAIRSLARICPDTMIAGVLNRNGLRTGRGNRWTQERVTSLRGYHQIPNHCPEKAQIEGWMTLSEAADSVGISARTLRLAIQHGMIEGEHPLGDGPWILNRSALQTEPARRLLQRVRQRTNKAVVPASEQKNFAFSRG